MLTFKAMLICTGEFRSKLDFCIAIILNGSQYHSHILLRAHSLISKKLLQEKEENQKWWHCLFEKNRVLMN